MKEQDAKALNAHQLVLYVERDDASYGPVQTGSYLAQEFIDDFFEKRERYRRDCLRRLEAGQISAVSYYFQILGLAEADLAVRVGVSRRAVRRHLTPAGFGEVDLRLACRYAEVFGVPLANLFQVVAAQDERVELRQERTANAMLTKTCIGVREPSAPSPSPLPSRAGDRNAASSGDAGDCNAASSGDAGDCNAASSGGAGDRNSASSGDAGDGHPSSSRGEGRVGVEP